jgi:HAE1 family hydrophobic/amphiphilic exporter-1
LPWQQVLVPLPETLSVLFVLFTRFSYGKKQLAWLQAHHEELMEKAKKVEEQNIDPELEYDIMLSHAENKASREAHEKSKEN